MRLPTQSMSVRSQKVLPSSCQIYWSTTPGLPMRYLANVFNLSADIALGHDSSWKISLTGGLGSLESRNPVWM